MVQCLTKRLASGRNNNVLLVGSNAGKNDPSRLTFYQSSSPFGTFGHILDDKQKSKTFVSKSFNALLNDLLPVEITAFC